MGEAGSRADRIAGLILGCAVGDALGLPYEGLRPGRVQRRVGPLRHAFLFGRGMFSDDTEHTLLVAQAWLEGGGNEARFERRLAVRLRWWFAGLPAGVGFATLRACLRLWLGFGPRRSGVFSAGNGPAMRAAVLAALVPRSAGQSGGDELLQRLVRSTTRVTHTDPRAEDGALAIALAARVSLDAPERLETPDGAADVLAEFAQRLTHPDSGAALLKVAGLVRNQSTVDEMVEAFGFARRGVSGFVVHTVAAALFCWAALGHDFRKALEAVVRLGGDTDTTGAIVGALVGARLGQSALPPGWTDGLREWPCTIRWMRQLGGEIAAAPGSVSAPAASEPAVIPPGKLWLLSIPRNLLFLTCVLGHGLRRLLPPW